MRALLRWLGGVFQKEKRFPLWTITFTKGLGGVQFLDVYTLTPGQCLTVRDGMEKDGWSVLDGTGGVPQLSDRVAYGDRTEIRSSQSSMREGLGWLGKMRKHTEQFGCGLIVIVAVLWALILASVLWPVYVWAL